MENVIQYFIQTYVSRLARFRSCEFSVVRYVSGAPINSIILKETELPLLFSGVITQMSR